MGGAPLAAPGGMPLGGAGMLGGAGIMTSPDAVLISDLPQGITDATLQSVFGAYGMIASHQMLAHSALGAQAIISFSTKEEANWCVEHLNGNIPQGLSGPIKCVFKNGQAAAGAGAPGLA